MQHGSLPLNRYGRLNTSILDDEDLAQQIHLYLIGIAKDGYVRAQDMVDMMSTPEMKHYLGAKSGITIQTGQQWLHKMNWQYGKATKGMYIDGHERIDVVVRGHRSISLPYLLYSIPSTPTPPCAYVHLLQYQ
jgi:hypothetical protein